MTGTTMKPAEIGPGEAAARARQRRTLINFGTLAAIGAVVGWAAAFVENKDAPLSAGGTMPGWFAILAAAVTVGAVAIGSWRCYRTMDELERLDNYFAGTLGANVFLGVYPVWLILWKGGLMPEPDAMILYGAVFVTFAAAYLWRKLR